MLLVIIHGSAGQPYRLQLDCVPLLMARHVHHLLDNSVDLCLVQESVRVGVVHVKDNCNSGHSSGFEHPLKISERVPSSLLSGVPGSRSERVQIRGFSAIRTSLVLWL